MTIEGLHQRLLRDLKTEKAASNAFSVSRERVDGSQSYAFRDASSAWIFGSGFQ
jgi:hypothetical protein